MDRSEYFKRIGYDGPLQPNLATLSALQRAHVQHIPFENLDVQLGRRVTASPQDAFGKLVTGHRGGWCYEMNGLFLWILESIGFDVMPMTAAILRAERGKSSVASHLFLCVNVGEPYLVDVGLTDSFEEPIPLREGTCELSNGSVRLERLDDGWWRFHNFEGARSANFDFQHRKADWSVVAATSDWLQTNPASQFVKNAVCVKRISNGSVSLIGRVLKRRDPDGVHQRLVVSADDHVSTLQTEFQIDLPQAASLWPKIVRRHTEMFGS